MRSGHCWGSAGRRWLRRMTGCTPVHGNIQNATAKAWRASSELGYRQDRHQIWCFWVSTGEAWKELYGPDRIVVLPPQTGQGGPSFVLRLLLLPFELLRLVRSQA